MNFIEHLRHMAEFGPVQEIAGVANTLRHAANEIDRLHARIAELEAWREASMTLRHERLNTIQDLRNKCADLELRLTSYETALNAAEKISCDIERRGGYLIGGDVKHSWASIIQNAMGVDLGPEGER